MRSGSIHLFRFYRFYDFKLFEDYLHVLRKRIPQGLSFFPEKGFVALPPRGEGIVFSFEACQAKGDILVWDHPDLCCPYDTAGMSVPVCDHAQFSFFRYCSAFGPEACQAARGCPLFALQDQIQQFVAGFFRKLKMPLFQTVQFHRLNLRCAAHNSYTATMPISPASQNPCTAGGAQDRYNPCLCCGTPHKEPPRPDTPQAPG